MESYLSDRRAIDRLISDYKKYGSLIIGCDFDDTLFDLHELGLDMSPVIELVKKCQDLKFTTCLWTACTDDWSLTYKKQICSDLGLKFDMFNESPSMNDSRKPHFSILLDDRAGLSAAYNILLTTLKELNL